MHEQYDTCTYINDNNTSYIHMQDETPNNSVIEVQ